MKPKKTPLKFQNFNGAFIFNSSLTKYSMQCTIEHINQINPNKTIPKIITSAIAIGVTILKIKAEAPVPTFRSS